MPVSIMHQKFRNRKRYDTLANNRRMETDSSGSNDPMNAHESNTDSESQVRMLTQKEADDEIENYVSPLAKQLENLTQLIQDTLSVHRQNFSPRAGTSANASAAIPLPDMATRDTRNSPDNILDLKTKIPWCLLSSIDCSVKFALNS